MRIILLLFLATLPQATPPAKNPPKTVAEAVHILKTRWLDADAEDWILRSPRETVGTRLHLPFGTGVRNEFKLWGGNPELMESCGVDDPESCSGVIFDRLWDSIRADANPELVRQLDCQFDLAKRLKISYAGFYKLRMGEMFDRLQMQIDQQLTSGAVTPAAGCPAELRLVPRNEPNLKCWVRAEFSEDERDPESLERFFNWIGFRNGFDVRHSPPTLEMTFHEKCAWPEPPKYFHPPKRKRR
jgi:hypothetical protein